MNSGSAVALPVVSSQLYGWNPAALPTSLTALLLVILAIVVIVRQRGARLAFLFSQMIFFVAVWFFAFSWMYCARDQVNAATWARIGVGAITFLPAAVYHFSATVLRLWEKRRLLARLLWTVDVVLAVFCLSTDAVVAGVYRYSWGYYPRFGWFAAPFLLIFGGVLVFHLLEYLRQMRRSQVASRRRGIRSLVISFAIVYLSAVDFLPMFHLAVYPFGFIFVAAFLIYAAGAIKRHRFNSITPARAAREILETMADALVVCDSEARIRVVNGAVRTLFGYAEADLLGKSIDALDPDESFPLRHLLSRGTLRDVETVVRARGGQRIDVSISVSPLSDSEVEAGSVLIARDIRERKRAEDERRDFVVKLQQSNRELEEFARVASHDLQEPLRKIQAFGDRLRTRCVDQIAPEGIDYLERMLAAAKRMQSLIGDLLSFSRVTTKAQAFVPVDLRAVIREVMVDLEVRIQQSGGRVEVAELPSIEADPLQMRQLFQNLISNALKFRHADVEPHVRIDSSPLRLAPDSLHNEDEWCEIRVADNGIGFDEKYLDRVFTVFQRLHGRSEYEGTGIGLAICRKIVERHGGQITAKSAPGSGAAFIITLPRHHRTREETAA